MKKTYDCMEYTYINVKKETFNDYIQQYSQKVDIEVEPSSISDSIFYKRKEDGHIIGRIYGVGLNEDYMIVIKEENAKLFGE